MLKNTRVNDYGHGKGFETIESRLKGGTKTHLLGQGWNAEEHIETDQAQFTVPQWDDIQWRLEAFYKAHAVEVFYNEGLKRPYKVSTYKAEE